MKKNGLTLRRLLIFLLDIAHCYLDNDNNNDHNVTVDANSNSFVTDGKSIETNHNVNNNDNDEYLIIYNYDDNNKRKIITCSTLFTIIYGDIYCVRKRKRFIH